MEDTMLKRMDNLEQQHQLSQMSRSLVASRQPPAKFVNCAIICDVHISPGMSMQHPAIQGFGTSMSRQRTARITYYRDSDDSDSDD